MNKKDASDGEMEFDRARDMQVATQDPAFLGA
jgi:hypothetical protein